MLACASGVLGEPAAKRSAVVRRNAGGGHRMGFRSCTRDLRGLRAAGARPVEARVLVGHLLTADDNGNGGSRTESCSANDEQGFAHGRSFLCISTEVAELYTVYAILFRVPGVLSVGIRFGNTDSLL